MLMKKRLDLARIRYCISMYGKNLPPVRKAFTYVVLAYTPEDPEEEFDTAAELYMYIIDRAIRDAKRKRFVKTEWLSVGVLRELKMKLMKLSVLKKGVKLISIGRDLREYEKDRELDELITIISNVLVVLGIPHEITPEGFVVLEEDYEDALEVIKGYTSQRASTT